MFLLSVFQYVGVLGGAVHDPHLAGVAALRRHLRRRRVLGRRLLQLHDRQPHRQPHVHAGSIVTHRARSRF